MSGILIQEKPTCTTETCAECLTVNTMRQTSIRIQQGWRLISQLLPRATHHNMKNVQTELLMGQLKYWLSGGHAAEAPD